LILGDMAGRKHNALIALELKANSGSKCLHGVERELDEIVR
jgi:hypothetical protein